MQNSKRESTGNGTAPLVGIVFSPSVAGVAGIRQAAAEPHSQPKPHPPANPLIRKPGQAPHRAAGTSPGVTTTYEPGYEKPSASPRESYWTC